MVILSIHSLKNSSETRVYFYAYGLWHLVWASRANYSALVLAEQFNWSGIARQEVVSFPQKAGW